MISIVFTDLLDCHFPFRERTDHSSVNQKIYKFTSLNLWPANMWFWYIVAGFNCQIRFNPCSNEPCQNGGLCNIDGEDYVCTCPLTYGGKLVTNGNASCSSAAVSKHNCAVEMGLFKGSFTRTITVPFSVNVCHCVDGNRLFDGQKGFWFCFHSDCQTVHDH